MVDAPPNALVDDRTDTCPAARANDGVADRADAPPDAPADDRSDTCPAARANGSIADRPTPSQYPC